jgi:serine phosphatase RsbU (regulator of sigma subunit)
MNALFPGKIHSCLIPGDDLLLLYTDGITEARHPGSTELFGEARLDAILASCACDAESIIRKTLLAVEEFTDSAAPMDDMTLLVAKAVA